MPVYFAAFSACINSPLSQNLCAFVTLLFKNPCPVVSIRVIRGLKKCMNLWGNRRRSQTATTDMVIVSNSAGRTFAAMPKSTSQTSPGLMPRILVLHAVKQLRASEGGLVAQSYVRVFVGDLEEHFADLPPVGCAHDVNLTGSAKIVIRQFHRSVLAPVFFVPSLLCCSKSVFHLWLKRNP
jgi:hypothetical protein